MSWKTQLITWLDHRTGVETAVRNFLYEKIPDSSGWRQVFGSVALFLFLVQAFTGALLAFYYVPSVESAYTTIATTDCDSKTLPAVWTVPNRPLKGATSGAVTP